MRFSQHFDLGMVQAELDFVDIDLTRDQPLFIDPYALQVRPDAWSIRCTQLVSSYFQALLDAVRAGNDRLSMSLLGSLHEPSETRLGLSRGHFKGNAIGSGLAISILQSLKASRAVATGLLTDISDTELFVQNIGRDRISDLVTNLIRRELIDYTQAQCKFHGVPLRRDVASGPYWDIEAFSWDESYVDLPVIGSQKILLVPKSAVRWEALLTPHEYYNDFVLEFLQARELRAPALGLVEVLKNGSRRVTKKSLKEAFPNSKDWLADFTRDHPEVLEAYKRAKAQCAGMQDSELDSGFDERAFSQALEAALLLIPPGNQSAASYHRFMKGALEFIFYPHLSQPCIEVEVNDGRKRIDITFLNSATSGFFHLFPTVARRPSIVVPVECKNYSRELGNPEVDQLAGRFANHRGWLGLLVCRSIDDRPGLIARCRDIARDLGGYPIPLDDQDVLACLRLIGSGQRGAVVDRIERLFRELTS